MLLKIFCRICDGLVAAKTEITRLKALRSEDCESKLMIGKLTVGVLRIKNHMALLNLTIGCAGYKRYQTFFEARANTFILSISPENKIARRSRSKESTKAMHYLVKLFLSK